MFSVSEDNNRNQKTLDCNQIFMRIVSTCYLEISNNGANM